MGDELRATTSSDETSSSSSDLQSILAGPTPAETLASGARLGALLGPCGARLRRRLGTVGSREGLDLLPRELKLLRAAVLHWVDTRDTWASFRHSCVGYRPGHGGAWWFTAPGSGSPRIRKGVHTVGYREGRPFSGVERPRDLAPPWAIEPGVMIVCELRRTGEIETPPEGLRTGLVYALGRGLELTAWREEARLARGVEEVWIERGEESFIVELGDSRTAKAG